MIGPRERIILSPSGNAIIAYTRGLTRPVPVYAIHELAYSSPHTAGKRRGVFARLRCAQNADCWHVDAEARRPREGRRRRVDESRRLFHKSVPTLPQ